MPKESNKPKRAMGPYNFFIKARRAHYIENSKPINFTEFSKECSAIWKTLTDEDKVKYTKDAQTDKIRYQKEMASFVPVDTKGGKKRKKKDPNQPKRALSAFFFFCGESRPRLRAQFPKAPVGDMAKKLGAEWRKLDESERAPYDAQALGDKARYEQEMGKFRKAVAKTADSDEPLEADDDGSSMSEGDKEA